MKHPAVLALCIAAVAATASAEMKPEDKITFRQSGYTFMRWNMGMIKNQVVDDPQTYNKEKVLAAANVIAATANSGIETLFTPDTEKGKGWKDTRVKPEFFKQPDDAKKRALDFHREADAMAKAAATGDVDLIKAQFDKLQKACKSCHEDFRTKE